MKLSTLPLFLLTFLVPQQALGIITLGLSTQTFGLTGLGDNSSGQGQSLMSWGTCAFDGTNTNCTLSGSYTGFGAGGTYSFVISYAGTGTFPLNAVATSTNQFTASATKNFNLVITLNQNSGPVIHFYSFYNFFFQFNAPVCTVVPTTGCNVQQVGATPGATMSGQIVGTFDPTPYLTPSGTSSAANYGGSSSIAPGTWIEMYGENLATTLSQTWAGSDFTGNQAPSALGGTTVTVGGIPAFVDYVSPGQVNVQVPSGVPNGTQPIVLTTAGGSSLPYEINVNTVQPGILAPSSFLINGHQYVVALEANTLTYILPVTVAGVSTTRAKVGDNLTLYGIGFGTVTPSNPAGLIETQLNALTNSMTVTIGGAPATITYAGLAPGYVGLYQFNVTVPNVPASDTTPVTFTLGSTNGTQNLVIAISN